jgi:rubredoxin
VPVGVHTLASGGAWEAAAAVRLSRLLIHLQEARGLPAQSIAPGTPFAEISAQWKCPDCGTDKTNFRPYVAKAAG